MSQAATTPRILVVDDESSVADAYKLQLELEFDDVQAAYGGEEALDKIDETIDVILLDRRMPNVSGDDVLEDVRERDLDCSVIMVTAVTPDFDIVEMPFDDYLCKPIGKDALIAAIDQQLTERDYDEGLSDYFSVVSKIGVLEAQKPSTELEDNEEYQRLKRRADELRGDLDQTVNEFDDMERAFMAVDRS